MDMVKIDVKPSLYDLDSHLNSSCSEENDLETLTTYSDTKILN